MPVYLYKFVQSTTLLNDKCHRMHRFLHRIGWRIQIIISIQRSKGTVHPFLCFFDLEGIFVLVVALQQLQVRILHSKIDKLACQAQSVRIMKRSRVILSSRPQKGRLTLPFCFIKLFLSFCHKIICDKIPKLT